MEHSNKILMKILSYPRELLISVNEKIGIELFKISIVLATIYAVQGMQSLTSIPLLFYLKDVLKFTDVQFQYFSAITSFAWLIKPLFGFISDRFPIFGYRRKTYMVLMALVACVSWMLLALMAYTGYTKYAVLVFVFNFSSLGYAFVDVVCDAIMVERGQKFNKEKFFVNLQWFSLGIAAAAAGFCGGYMQSLIKAGAIQIYLVFILTGIIPCISATISWFCVSEERIKKLTSKKNLPSLEAKNIDIIMQGGRRKSKESWKIDELMENFRNLKNANTEIKPAPQKNTAEKKPTANIFKEILSSRIFWILSAFIFFWKFSPSFGAVFSYYLIDILKFDEIFLGINIGIGNALFPLAIILYMALLKWFPKIKAKHYLYASVIIGIIYYLVDLLYFIPETSFNYAVANIPYGDISWLKWLLILAAYLIFIGAIYFLIKILAINRKSFKQISKQEYGEYEYDDFEHNVDYFHNSLDRYRGPKTDLLRRLISVMIWLILLPISIPICLAAAGIPLTPLTLGYRSIYVLNNVIFSYATIASFLIPLALAAELAPKKAEGMTYAYFMALSNIAGTFLNNIAGGWMIDILKKMLHQPETVVSLNSNSLLAILLGLALIAASILIAKKLVSQKKWTVFLALVAGAAIIFYFFGPIFLGHLKSVAAYLVQQSYLILKPYLGTAAFLGKEAYRALILRYSIIIGIIFVLISAIFVYLLPKGT